MNVHFQCVIQVCRFSCPEMCSDQSNSQIPTQQFQQIPQQQYQQSQPIAAQIPQSVPLPAQIPQSQGFPTQIPKQSQPSPPQIPIQPQNQINEYKDQQPILQHYQAPANGRRPKNPFLAHRAKRSLSNSTDINEDEDHLDVTAGGFLQVADPLDVTSPLNRTTSISMTHEDEWSSEVCLTFPPTLTSGSLMGLVVTCVVCIMVTVVNCCAIRKSKKID